MKRKISLLSLVFLFSFSISFAQSDYKTGIGMKFYPGAFSVKQFVNETTAIEGLLSFWDRGTRITGLYEVHRDIESVQGLKWYFGGGAHISFFKEKYGGVSPGIDGVIGLDYKFNGAPVNLSLDWQPSFELGDYESNRFVGNWGGLAFRFVF